MLTQPSSRNAKTLVLEVYWAEDECRIGVSDTAEDASPLISLEKHSISKAETETASQAIFNTIRQANLKSDHKGNLSSLEEMGSRLFELLLPPVVRKGIRHSQADFLLLKLDESCVHLPWELVHDGHAFLCCRFAMGRLVRTHRARTHIQKRRPSQQLSLLILSNPAGDLPKSSEEGQLVIETAKPFKQVAAEWLNGRVQLKTLEEWLTEFDVVHFSGHSERSGWVLADGEFTSKQLEPYVLEGKPVPALVFSNACHGGMEGWEEGSKESEFCLATAFTVAGCNHYIGAWGEVVDTCAGDFSPPFFEMVLSGMPVGKALQECRLRCLSDCSDAGLSWSQYVLFGDPRTSLLPKEVEEAEAPPQSPISEQALKPQFLTLLFADMADSTAITQEIGDFAGTALIKQMRQVCRDLLSEFSGGEEIGTAGDSFLVSFGRPSDAFRFALILHSRLRSASETTPKPIAMRVAIHLGEVLVEAESGGPKDIHGAQVDVAARLMGLSSGGQTLASRGAFDSARSVLRREDFPGLNSLSWLTHGPYKLKGLEEPVEICEVGEESLAPLKLPPDSDKAFRFFSVDQEPVLGWRPAVGREIPTAPGWFLVERLGEGAFGEVWRAHNREEQETHAIKFCFRADRVRALKREVKLFQLLERNVGNHPNIVRILGVYFDSPPYYIEMEDCGGQDLARWTQSWGGPSLIPIETRLHIVAEVAEGLQAAHDSGFIHRDVKPSNILISGRGLRPEDITVHLTDFGIGQIVEDQIIAGMTMSGFTETMSGSSLDTRSGSRLYMAPEVLSGKSSSIRSDIYSLGVVLYQLVVGDLNRAVGGDWRDYIEDPLVAEDLAHCFPGDPADRFQSAGQLAESLRSLEQRRQQMKESDRIGRKALRRRRLVVALTAFAVALALLGGGLGYGLLQEHRARETAESELYISSLQQIEGAIEDLRFDRALEILLSCPVGQRNWEWGHLLYRCNQDLTTLRGHTNEVGTVAFGPDGSWVVSCSSDGTVRMWDLRTGTELRRFEGHTKPVWTLAVSPDGKMIATGSEDTTAILWDGQSGQQLHVLTGHHDHVESVAFSPDGRSLATGARESTVRIWDVSSGEEKDRLSFKEKEEVNALAFSPDGTQIAESVGYFPSLYSNPESVVKMIRIIDLSTKSVRWEISDPENARSIAFNPQGTKLAAGLGNDAKVWDLENRKLLWHFKGHENPVWCVAFSKKGDFLATASIDRTIRFWDLTVGETVRTLKGHSRAIYSISFDPSGRMLASSSEDGTIKVWDASIAGRRDTLKGHDAGISSLVFSADGKIIASAGGKSGQGKERMVNLWNPQTGARVRTIEGFSDQPNALSISPDGKTLCVGTDDCMLWTVDQDSGLIREKVKVTTLSGLPVQDNIVACPFSPDGKRIAVGLHNGEISVWQALSLTKITSVSTLKDKGFLSFLSWSPDGHALLSSGGSERTMDTASIEYRNSESLQLSRTMPAHAYDVRDLVFSPDSRFFATASMDATAKLWNADGSGEPKVLQGHRDFLTSVVFTPDGTRLVTGSIDKTAKMWRLDMDRPRETLDLKGAHSEEIDKLAISPDGRIIATGSLDKTIHLWRSFPWKWEDYPGSKRDDPVARFEKFKRARMLN